ANRARCRRSPQDSATCCAHVEKTVPFILRERYEISVNGTYLIETSSGARLAETRRSLRTQVVRASRPRARESCVIGQEPVSFFNRRGNRPVTSMRRPRDIAQ